MPVDLWLAAGPWLARRCRGPRRRVSIHGFENATGALGSAASRRGAVLSLLPVADLRLRRLHPVRRFSADRLTPCWRSAELMDEARTRAVGAFAAPLLAASLTLLPGGHASLRLTRCPAERRGSMRDRRPFRPGHHGTRHLARILAVELPSRDVLPAGAHHATAGPRPLLLPTRASRAPYLTARQPCDSLFRAGRIRHPFPRFLRGAGALRHSARRGALRDCHPAHRSCNRSR